MKFDQPKQLTFPSFPPAGALGPPASKKQREQRSAAFRANVRRQAQLARAAEVVPRLPAPGESLHCLMTGYFDFMLVLKLVIEGRAPACARLRIATLAFSAKNVQELAKLLDSGKVGTASLLCSDFMAKSNPKIYQGALTELTANRPGRGKVASARSHCKVALLDFDDGLKVAFEGSANLRTNRNAEQLTVFADAGLHDWHAEWIDAKVGDGDRPQEDPEEDAAP
jgi:hypothetical protein